LRAASDDNSDESAVESPAEIFKKKGVPIGAAPTGSNKGKFSQMMSGMASKAKGLKKKMKGKGKKSKQSAGAVGDGEEFQDQSGAGSAGSAGLVDVGTGGAGDAVDGVVGADAGGADAVVDAVVDGADAAAAVVGSAGEGSESGDASNAEVGTSPPPGVDALDVDNSSVPEAAKEKEDPVKAAAAEKLANLKAKLAATKKKSEEKKATTTGQASVAVVPVVVNLRDAPALSARPKSGIGRGKRSGSRKGLMGGDADEDGGGFEETSFPM
jgi:hypothetical protein